MSEFLSNPGFFVITGGPGSGKTSLLHELEKAGYHCEPEVARKIIREQLQSKGEALPWCNKISYLHLMIERSVESYKRLYHANTKICFFDRGLPDAIAYATLIKAAIDDQTANYATQYKYNKKVFMLPPWLAIYTTDTERKQTWEEAVETYHVLTDTYKAYGYEIWEVPPGSLEERKNFVISNLQMDNS